MAKQKKLIIANWKMNPKTLKEARTLFSSIKKAGSKLRNIQTVVCTPSLYLTELQKIVSGHRVLLGAQDIFYENEGAHTGEISPVQLKGAGMQYVIIGHSERRAIGETNDVVAKKVRAALKENLNVVLCIGEKERDSEGEYLHFLREQLRESLKGVAKLATKKLIVTYEPVWAISSHKKGADTSEDAIETILFVRKILSEIFDKKIAMSTPVIYGGSVNPKNAKSFFVGSNIDGLLIGRASLDSVQFNKILKESDKN